MDRNTFRRLLSQAIGPRTQKSFAELCGMTPQYLNRLLHSDSVVPTMDTLTRIAAHAYDGVTFAALCKTCDIDPASVEKESKFSPWELASEHKRASIVNQALHTLNDNWFHRESGPNAMIFKSLDQVTDMISEQLSQMLETDKKTFSCELIKDVNGQAQLSFVHGMALYPVVLTWEESYFVCRHKFMLQVYSVTSETNELIVVGLNLAKSDLEKAFVQEVAPTDGDSDPNDIYTEIFYRNLSNTYESPAEKILREMFGTASLEVDVPDLEEGEGFYTPDLKDPAVQEKVAAFFQKHAHMIPDNAGTADNLYADYVDEHEQCEYCNGTFGLVAYIMGKEAGFPFTYLNNPDFEHNRPIIMMSDIFIKEENGPERQTVRAALIPYAIELGVDKIGTVWNQYYKTVPITPEINVKPDAKKQEEARQDFSEN